MEDAPILFVDDDQDDQSTLKQALAELQSIHPLLSFTDAQAALDYLQHTQQAPFLIISEVSLAGMNGLELRRQIDQQPALRKKAIPFIFLTTPLLDYLVEEAYELPVQGLFEKKQVYADWKTQLKGILDYWQECAHPKSFNR